MDFIAQQNHNTQTHKRNEEDKCMKRATSIALCLLLVAGVVFAASVHFKRDPNFTDTGLTLSGTVSLAGLGNGDVTIIIDAEGSPTTVCQNPGTNAFEPAGQNPADFDIPEGSLTVSANQIKNGNLTVTVATGDPVQPTAQDAGCNRNWTAEITDVAFTSATITVVQGGVIVLQQSFSL
jgi:hypothetical protein